MREIFDMVLAVLKGKIPEGVENPVCADVFCVPRQKEDESTAAFRANYRRAFIEKSIQTFKAENVEIYTMGGIEDLTDCATALEEQKIRFEKEDFTFDDIEAFANTHFGESALQIENAFVESLELLVAPLRTKYKATLPIFRSDIFTTHPEFKDIYENTKTMYLAGKNEFQGLVNSDALHFLKRNKRRTAPTQIDTKNPLHMTRVLYVIKENAILKLWGVIKANDLPWKKPNCIPHEEFNSSMGWMFNLLKNRQHVPITSFKLSYKEEVVEVEEEVKGRSSSDSSTSSTDSTPASPPASAAASSAAAPAAFSSATARPTVELFVNRQPDKTRVWSVAFRNLGDQLQAIINDLDTTVHIMTAASKEEIVKILLGLCTLCNISLTLPKEWSQYLTGPSTPPDSFTEEIALKAIPGKLNQLKDDLSGSFNDGEPIIQFFYAKMKHVFKNKISDALEKVIGKDFLQKGQRYIFDSSSSGSDDENPVHGKGPGHPNGHTRSPSSETNGHASSSSAVNGNDMATATAKKKP